MQNILRGFAVLIWYFLLYVLIFNQKVAISIKKIISFNSAKTTPELVIGTSCFFTYYNLDRICLLASIHEPQWMMSLKYDKFFGKSALVTFIMFKLTTNFFSSNTGSFSLSISPFKEWWVMLLQLGLYRLVLNH